MQDPIEYLFSKIETPGMMRRLSELSQWKKYSASSDERAFIAYLQNALDDLGFETKLLFHDAYLSIPREAHVELEGQMLRAITHSFGASTATGGLAARLHYCGRGTAADYRGRDVRGAIVLIDGMATPSAAWHASRAGAAGQLHVSPHDLLHRCAFRPYGAALHNQRGTVFRRLQSFPSRVRTAKR